MRLFEFADAKASLELWKLINDCVWKAISVQAQEQERIEQEQALKQKKKPKIVFQYLNVVSFFFVFISQLSACRINISTSASANTYRNIFTF